jgi:hypothetical protein
MLEGEDWADKVQPQLLHVESVRQMLLSRDVEGEIVAMLDRHNNHLHNLSLNMSQDMWMKFRLNTTVMKCLMRSLMTSMYQ